MHGATDVSLDMVHDKTACASVRDVRRVARVEHDICQRAGVSCMLSRAHGLHGQDYPLKTRAEARPQAAGHARPRQYRSTCQVTREDNLQARARAAPAPDEREKA